MQRQDLPAGSVPVWGPGPADTRFQKDPLQFLLDASRECGDFFTFLWEGHRIYMLNHPDDIVDCLLSRQKLFSRSGGPRRLAVLLGEGLLRSQGEKHRRQRLLTQPAFAPRQLSHYAATMETIVAEKLEACPTNVIVDFHTFCTDVTLTIAAKTFFSLDLGSRTEAIGSAFDGAIRNLPPASSKWREWWRRHKFDRSIKILDDILFELISHRRLHGGPEDLLSTLLGGMDDRQLRDELMTLFTAGHETTASALTWALHLIAEHPETQKAPPTDAYARALFAETLRLYPPAWMLLRRVGEDTQIRGCPVPKGSHLLFSPYVVGRDARFFEEPSQFRPSRWDEERDLQGAFFPFGLGQRKCLGESFAWLEGTVFLKELLGKYHLRPAPGPGPVPEAGFTLRPRDGLNLILSKR